MIRRSRTSLIPVVAMATFLGAYMLVPSGSAQPPTPGSARAPSPASTRAAPSRSVESSRYFPNCDAARAAGAAPLYAGQPGYRGRLDRDGDGVACEPYRGR